MSETVVQSGRRFLQRLCEIDGGAGDESRVSDALKQYTEVFVDAFEVDPVGNATLFCKGEGQLQAPKVMIAAHMDEISLMVMKIEEGGFLRVAEIGGFDPRTLLGQEVLVHGRQTFKGVIGAKPPHLSSAEERKKTIPLAELFIDLGMPEHVIRQFVTTGDRVTIFRKTMDLLGDRMSGKAMDDRASVVAMAMCLQELRALHVYADVYAVGTVQEEIGSKGAQTAAFRIAPDIAIAIDVCHGETPGVAEDLVQKIGRGPVITFGPNIHPKLFSRLRDVAEANHIPYQIEVSQGATWTDADPIQITQCGIPTCLISIPLRYMHTSVETLAFSDVYDAAILMARFIASIQATFVEDLTCY